MTKKMCRATGCPKHAEPRANWCFSHQLLRWEQMPADLKRHFAVRSVEDITTNESGCWLYAGKRNPTSGYAVGEFAGQRVFVHRWMFWYLVGGLQESQELHHICGGAGEQETRHCIRPAHLMQMLPDKHDNETDIRKKMLAAAEPGARFYQTAHGERSMSAEFAREQDLPRHEPRFNTELSTDDELVVDWNLVIPERFRADSH